MYRTIKDRIGYNATDDFPSQHRHSIMKTKAMKRRKVIAALICVITASGEAHQSRGVTAFMSMPVCQQRGRSSSEVNMVGILNQPYTQVISDVDDTLKSSGGVNVGGVALGGIDVQYKRGDFYPGVFQFMLELSLSSGSITRESIKIPPKVSILTARAEEFKVALELKEDSKLAVAFRKTGEEAGISDWGLGPVLYGSVAEWILQDRKGLRKFSNFERLLQQDPTGTIIQVMPPLKKTEFTHV
jgi:hypothetical protein